MPQQSHLADLAERLDETVSSMRISTRGVGQSALEKQTAACRWLVEALYQGFCCLPRAAVALPRAGSAYSSNRPGSVPHGYDVVSRVLEAAVALGWIEVTIGFQSAVPGQGQVTRIVATGDLLERFQGLDVQWRELEPPPVESLLILAMEKKGKGRRLTTRGEDARVGPMQDNLYRINEFLFTQCISLNCSNDLLLGATGGVIKQVETGLGDDRHNPIDRPRAINFQHVAMSRIFAHGSLDKGGRFYNGWWQHIRSMYRDRITINGRLTVECDYAGIALVCLYALVGEPMEPGDAYDIGLDYNGSGDPRRKIVKQHINAIINDADKKYRISSDKLKILGLTSKELRHRINLKHKAIKHKFNTGIGLHLQYIDSKIAEQVMLRFVEMGEVCLPIHDSFIVRRGLEKQLLSTMQSEFERETGTTIDIKSACGESGDGIGSLSPSIQPRPGIDGIESIVEMFTDHMASHSICNEYLNSWRQQYMSEEDRQAEDLALDEDFERRKDTSRRYG